MKFYEKNYGGIELHLNQDERKLLCKSIRFYIAKNADTEGYTEEIKHLTKIMNALHLAEFGQVLKDKAENDAGETKEPVTFKDLEATLLDLILLCDTFTALNESFSNNPESFPGCAWTMPIEQLGELVDRANDLFEDIRPDK